MIIEYSTHVMIRTKPFKLFKAVVDNSNFNRVLIEVWERRCERSSMFQLWFKLKKLKYALKDLNSYMATYAQRLKYLRQSLDMVQRQITNASIHETLIQSKKKILVDIQWWTKVNREAVRQKSREN